MVLQTTSINYLYSSFPHYYLCDYRPLSAGKDIISRSLLKFKHRTQPDFSTWIKSALEALQGISLTPETIILRALHHDEMTVRVFPTALDFLGHALAGHFGCRYLPSFLRKSRPARPCKELSHRQRKTELRNIYSLDPAAHEIIAVSAAFPALPDHSAPASAAKALAKTATAFLLIDDILTTGTTMRMIIQPLHRTFPRAPIRIFTLARANDNPPSTGTSALANSSTVDTPSAAGITSAANAISNPPPQDNSSGH